MRLIIIVLSFFLITCGGGSTGPEQSQNPTAQNINSSTNEDTPVTFIFLGADPQNLSLTYQIESSPPNGSVQINGQQATYTPNANHFGTDTFTYSASNGTSKSNIATVLIVIIGTEDDPNSLNQSVAVDEDNSIDITLTAEEYDGDGITFSIKSDSSNGTVNLSGNIATYTPNQDYFGADSFTFEAVDVSDKKIINIATISITIVPVNDAPVANDMNKNIGRWVANRIYLDGTDIDSDNLSYSIVSDPTLGSISISGNEVIYTPNQDSGQDSFSYEVSDGTLTSNVGTVNINIGRLFSIWDSGGWDSAFEIFHDNYEFKIFGDTNFISGSTYDALFLKVYSDGTEQYYHTFGGNDTDVFLDVLENQSDNTFVAVGYSKSYGDGSRDYYIVKMDQDGGEIWSKSWGGSETETLGQIELNNLNGNYRVIAKNYTTQNYFLFDIEDEDGSVIKSTNIDYSNIDLYATGFGWLQDSNDATSFSLYINDWVNATIHLMNVSNGDTTLQLFDNNNNVSFVEDIFEENGSYSSLVGLYFPANPSLDVSLVRIGKDGDEEWRMPISVPDPDGVYNKLEVMDAANCMGEDCAVVLVNAQYLHDFGDGISDWVTDLFAIKVGANGSMDTPVMIADFSEENMRFRGWAISEAYVQQGTWGFAVTGTVKDYTNYDGNNPSAPTDIGFMTLDSQGNRISE